MKDQGSGAKAFISVTTADLTKLERAVPELDRLGAEGWEAVGLVTSWGAGWKFVHPVVLLKRPLPEPA